MKYQVAGTPINRCYREYNKTQQKLQRIRRERTKEPEYGNEEKG
jgi:hypothetical protein